MVECQVYDHPRGQLHDGLDVIGGDTIHCLHCYQNQHHIFKIILSEAQFEPALYLQMNLSLLRTSSAVNSTVPVLLVRVTSHKFTFLQKTIYLCPSQLS